MEHTVEFNGEQHEVPHNLFIGETDVEQVKQSFLGTLEKQFGSTSNETPPIVSNEPQVAPAPEPVQSNEAAPAEPDSNPSWWSKYNITNEQDESSFMQKLADFEEKHPTLSQREEVLSKKEPFLHKLENPFASQEDFQVNEFKKLTGLTGKAGTILAIDVISSSLEELKSDPVRAIALAKVIDNPSRMKDISLEDYIGKIERDATRSGVNLEDKDSAEYKDFYIDAIESIEKIEKYREKFGNFNNPFESLRQANAEHENVISERTGLVKGEINNFIPKNLKVTVKGKEITLETPKSVLDAIDDNVIRSIASSHDARTPEGKQNISKDLENFVLYQSVTSGNLVEQLYEKVFEQVSEDVAKKQFNGQNRVIERVGTGSKQDAPMTEMDKRFQEIISRNS